MAKFTTKQREKLADEDEAMPDGSYPIRNRSDLKNAIQAFGRSKNPAKTKAWIKKRARELDAEDLIPESWLEHADDDAYLIHYGVLGMKWGVRKARKTGGTYNYTSMKTKRLTKKAAKAKSEGKTNAGKIAAKAKASKQSDKNRLAYAKKTSVGKAIAQNLLLGPVYAQSYQKMRANDVTRGKALLKNMASRAALMSIPLTGFIGANVALNANLANMTMPQIINAVNTLGTTYQVSNTAAAAAGSYIAGNKATTSSAKKKKTTKKKK